MSSSTTTLQPGLFSANRKLLSTLKFKHVKSTSPPQIEVTNDDEEFSSNIPSAFNSPQAQATPVAAEQTSQFSSSVPSAFNSPQISPSSPPPQHATPEVAPAVDQTEFLSFVPSAFNPTPSPPSPPQQGIE
jgi:hypothetical protein